MEIGHSFKRLQQQGISIFYYKLVDTKMFEFSLFCNHCHQKVKHNLILPKTIADFLVIVDTAKQICKDINAPVTSFHECKSSKNAKGFPLRNVKAHQLEYGLTMAKLGVDYWLHINDRRKVREFKCYSVTATQYAEIVNNIQLQYIPWRSLERVAISSERIKGGLWDIKKVIL